MKGAAALGLTVIAAWIISYEWVRMNVPNRKRDRLALAGLTALGLLLGILLLYIPDMPGPTDLLRYLFRPFSKLIP